MKALRIAAALFAALFILSLRAGAASLEEIGAPFKYDKSAPLNIEIVEQIEQHNSIKYKFFYDSPSGERVPALLVMPKKKIKGGAPAVFFMHFHASDKTLSDIFSTTWAGYGMATMAIDGVFRGERANLDGDILDPNPEVAVGNFKTQILDMLRGIDVLAQWEGVNPDRLGFYGISAGAISGVPTIAMDPRIKAAALVDGGGSFDIIYKTAVYGAWDRVREYIKQNNLDENLFAETFKNVDPVTFAPYVKAATLMVNGDADLIVPVPAIKALHEALGGKKEMVWFEGGHYDVPLEVPLVTVRQFFASHLKPAKKEKS